MSNLESLCKLFLADQIVKQIHFALILMDISSPHSSEQEFPFTEAKLRARHSFVWLLAFLQNLHPIYAPISQAAVIFKLAL